jgi:hypothetical protein
MPRFPPQGPLGVRSPASPVLSRHSDFPTSVPPHFVSFAWRYHQSTRLFSSLPPSPSAGGGPGVVNPVSPSGVFFVETSGSPKFLGDPYSRLHMVSDPGRPIRSRPYGTFAWPPDAKLGRRRRSANFRGSIAWLSGSLSTYHEWIARTSRKTGFQVLVRLSWAGFYPQGLCRRFLTHLMFVVLLLQASWHNLRLCAFA